MDYIDLHTHSYKSDGALSPAAVVDEAKKAGLRAIALTDHDVTDGLPEAMARGKEVGVEVVPGIELSSKGEAGAHILGYYIDTEDKAFSEKLEELRRMRVKRNRETAENLQKIGFPITVEDVRENAPNGIIGRAHFAKYMADRGYVSSVKEAFDKYLGNGKPGFSYMQLLTPAEAVGVIKSAGGIAVLAHLNQTKLTGKALWDFVGSLRDAGLDGVEGYYTEYTDEMEKEVRKIAADMHLKISGGTDFHGAMKPHIRIGSGTGNLRIPYSVLENLR